MRNRWFVIVVAAAPGCTSEVAGQTGATGSASSSGVAGESSGTVAGEPTTGAPGGSTDVVEPTSAGPTSAGPTSIGEGTETSGVDTGSTGSTAADTGTAGPGTTGDRTDTDDTGAVACMPEVHQGVATYYAADGSGNCSYPPSPGDLMVAAMNHEEYAGSATCGACVHIVVPDGSVTVRIVDRCPECPVGHIDLSEQAFEEIAAKGAGKVPIQWYYVPCPVDGAISYHFKEGSNQWWTAVQVRNHRNAVAGFEYKDPMGVWTPVPRVDYNYFLAESGMGPGPYSFRVTDVAGNVLEDAGVPLVEAGDSPGAGQFPGCEP